MGRPGVPTQMPTGTTSKLPPLKETLSRVTWKAFEVLETVYGGVPPNTKIVAWTLLPAHVFAFGPTKVIESGEVKNPGLDPVACAMVKLARWKAPVPISVICSNAV